MNGHVILSLSGGMDSTSLLLHFLAKKVNVTALSFNYGQNHSIELQRAEECVAYIRSCGVKLQHHIIDLRSAFEHVQSSLLHQQNVPIGHYEEISMKATVVPNRNAIFASIIFARALTIKNAFNQHTSIALGVHSGDHTIYPDCRPEFFDAIYDAFKIGNWDAEDIEISLPFLHKCKADILRDALSSCDDLGLDFDEIFKRTITSYQPDERGRSHGKTGSDVERILAFHSIGRIDPIEYMDTWDAVLNYALAKETEFKDEQYRQQLTELEYQVTRQGATERAFTGKFWDFYGRGTYSCVCCGHLLFSSEMKYSSGCGWPSFHSELDTANINRSEDLSHGMARVEVKCSRCDSHLGHVFDDGPIPFGGERYCINSASLNFQEEKL